MKLLTAALLLATYCANAQYVEEENESNNLKGQPFGQRLVFGGGLGANFSNGYTVLEISPLVGYKVTDRFIPGIGVSYTYLSFLGNSYSIYGFNAWARYMILDNFFAHTEYQQNNFPFSNERDEIMREWVPMWLVGGGYHTGRESAVGFSIMVLWDLIDDIRSPYDNPIIRGGVMIGF